MKQPSKQGPSTAPPGVDSPAPATVLDIKKILGVSRFPRPKTLQI